MITTITRNDFVDAFSGVGGWSDTYKNNFSYEGLRALFEYFEESEEGTGETIEFDRVAIACEYSEYENLKELQEEYTSDIETLEDLSDHTAVIPIDNTDRIIIQNF